MSSWHHYPKDPPEQPGKYMVLTDTIPDSPFTMDYDYVTCDRMAFGSYHNEFDPSTLGFVDSEFTEANFESEIFAWCKPDLPDEKFMDEVFNSEE